MLVLGAVLNAQFALGQKKQTLTISAGNLMVVSPNWIDRSISRKDILAITVRAFHKRDLHIFLGLRLLIRVRVGRNVQNGAMGHSHDLRCREDSRRRCSTWVFSHFFHPDFSDNRLEFMHSIQGF
jgi:hypothetical protein